MSAAEKPDLLDIADIIHEARLYVGAIRMATAGLSGDQIDSLALIATQAIEKLVDARDALEAICEEQATGGASASARMTGGQRHG